MRSRCLRARELSTPSTHDQRNRSPRGIRLHDRSRRHAGANAAERLLPRSSHPPADARARVRAHLAMARRPRRRRRCRARSRRARCCPGISTSRSCLRATPAGAALPLQRLHAPRQHPGARAPCRAEQIRCGYHSRRFDLAGRMTFMPGFEQAQDFPGPSDHLPRVPFGDFAGQAFASLAPAAPFEAFFARDRRAPGVAAARRAPPRSDARPRVRDRRALGALRRELPRGPAHSLPASGAEPGARHGALRATTSGATAACSSRGRARATRRSSCRPPRPTMASGSRRTTGGCSRT